MPNPWKTTQKRLADFNRKYVNVKDGSNKIIPVEIENDPYDPSLMSVMMFDLLGINAQTPAEEPSALSTADYPPEYAGQKNRQAQEIRNNLVTLEQELRTAVKEGNNAVITDKIASMRAQLDPFFANSQDLTDPLVAQMYRVRETVALADTLCQGCTAVPDKDAEPYRKCREALGYFRIDETESGYLPDPEGKKETEQRCNDLVNGYHNREDDKDPRNVTGINEIAAQMNTHLEKQFEIYLANRVKEKEKKYKKLSEDESDGSALDSGLWEEKNEKLKALKAEIDAAKKDEELPDKKNPDAPEQEKLQKLRDEFEADYYRQYYRYQEAKQSLESFTGYVKELLRKTDASSYGATKISDCWKFRSVPSTDVDNIANVDNSEINTLLYFSRSEMVAIITMLNNPENPPKTRSEREERDTVHSVKKTSDLIEKFQELYMTPLNERLKRMESFGDYHFDEWDKMVGQQEKNTKELANIRSNIIEGCIAKTLGVDFGGNYRKQLEEKRGALTRGFYDAMNNQFRTLQNELGGISTRVGGNSDDFTDMLTAVNDLRNWKDPNTDKLSAAEKADLLKKLDKVIAESQDYMKAKRIQKGLEDGQEPTFRTTKGKKRYEYARKISEIAGKMKSAMALAENKVVNTNKIFDETINSMSAGGFREMQAAYEKKLDKICNLPRYVDGVKEKYHRKLNLFDKGISGDNLNSFKREFQEINDSRNFHLDKGFHTKYYEMKEYNSLYNKGLSESMKVEVQKSENTLNVLCGEANSTLRNEGLGIFSITQAENEANINRTSVKYTSRQVERDDSGYQKALQEYRKKEAQKEQKPQVQNPGLQAGQHQNEHQKSPQIGAPNIFGY